MRDSELKFGIYLEIGIYLRFGIYNLLFPVYPAWRGKR
ncbi:Uncharacterized protein dnm_010390 [Desulfonema magnum]|uniref:Uncharacterized protein n=1 Tax=Desulfonema magnum TaxID=45655 RepID=A0A975GKZ5_9BACT|nr:Uncharacterized protein dnm_010390 [Desulfonema magnum]